MTDSSIRHTILTVLAEVAPYPLPAAQLLRDVNRLIAPPLADALAMHEQHLTWMLDRKWIDFQRDSFDPDDGLLNRWLITQLGETMLQRGGSR